jgi:hypothetical protein
VTLVAQYSPQRAVANYFNAQARGDGDTMMSNAILLRGDGSHDRFFDSNALKAMLAIDQNRQLSQVKILSADEVDQTTSDVQVSLVWGGTARTKTYRVLLDPSRTHYQFYHPWRIQIPYVTVHVTLPKQPGALRIDELDAPPAETGIQLIEGYHSVALGATDFYDPASQVVAGFDSDVSATFEGKLTSLAVASAKAAVNRSFVLCPSGSDCLGRTYYVHQKPGYITTEYWNNLPGYKEIDASNMWKWSLSGDPTAGIVLMVANEANIVNTSGSCGMTLTVDGSKKYRFKGTWTAKLTWTSSGFVADLIDDCIQAKA